MTIVEIGLQLREFNPYSLRVTRKIWGADAIWVDKKYRLVWCDTGEVYKPTIEDLTYSDWIVLDRGCLKEAK